MTHRIKPFPYDALETSTSIIFVLPHQGADGRQAEFLLAPNGLQITRADGKVIRFGNLHPRLRDVLLCKYVYACEVDGDVSTIYSLGPAPKLGASLVEHLGEAFYWYLGPETATLQDVAARPAAVMLQSVVPNPIAVAPGQDVAGPLIGLCRSAKGFLPLARGRRWAQARRGLIVDMGLASGSVAGFPANDNLLQSVFHAHEDNGIAPQDRPRQAWSSQVACAFPESV